MPASLPPLSTGTHATQKFFPRVYPGELAVPWGRKKSGGGEGAAAELEKRAVGGGEADGAVGGAGGPGASLWGRNGRAWPVVTAGAGLFSDGYVNNSMGTVNTCLGVLYGDLYEKSAYVRTVASIVFAGIICGMFIFGFVADYYSRKQGMVITTVVLMVFTVCCAGSWWGGSVQGMLTLLIVFRFFVGIGIGGEYPASSVACSEASAAMSKGTRNRWFIVFTAFMVDFGYVMATVVPLALLYIFTSSRLEPVWRLTIGLGVVPPLALFYFRTRFDEPETFRKNNLKRGGFPFAVAARYYGFRLLIISLLWFLYDFVAYPFGIFQSAILTRVVEDGNLYESFAWNILLTACYLPGALVGAVFADWFGPRLTLAGGLTVQAILGFVMVATFDHLVKRVWLFVLLYGLFMSLGELGGGGNIKCFASKSSPTAIRGLFYCVAAVSGKTGALAGTQIFPLLMGDDAESISAPFWVCSAMCFVAALLAFFFLPPITQATIQEEDALFRVYLERHGYDVSKIGDRDAPADAGAAAGIAAPEARAAEGVGPGLHPHYGVHDVVPEGGKSAF